MQNPDQRVDDILIDHGDTTSGFSMANQLRSSSNHGESHLRHAYPGTKASSDVSERKSEGTIAVYRNQVKKRSSKAHLVGMISLLCIGGFLAGLIGRGMHTFPKHPIDHTRGENGIFASDGESGLPGEVEVGALSSGTHADALAKIKQQQAQICQLRAQLEESRLILRAKAEWGMHSDPADQTEDMNQLQRKVQWAVELMKESERLKGDMEALQKAVSIIDKQRTEDDKSSNKLDDSGVDMQSVLLKQRQRLDAEETSALEREKAHIDSKEIADRQAKEIYGRLDAIGAKQQLDQERLESLSNIEDDVSELKADLERLQERLLKSRESVLGGGKEQLRHRVQVLLARCGEVRDKWREGVLISTVHMYRILREHAPTVRKTIIDYINSMQFTLPAMHLLALNTRERMERIEDYMKRDPSEDLRAALLWGLSVKSGVSKVLNDRELEWEERRGRALSGIPEAKGVRSLKESLEEQDILGPVKEEIKAAIGAGAETAPPITTERESAMLRRIIESVEPLGDPHRVLVRNFTLLGGGVDAQSADVEFQVLDAVGSGSTSLVVTVQAVDPYLREKLGDTVMKIPVISSDLDMESIEHFTGILEERIESETTALASIVNLGETQQDALLRTRILAATHTGSISDSKYLTFDVDGETFILLPKLVFLPRMTCDYLSLYMSDDFPPLSMKARVYLAHSVLHSIAHMHLKGYCHNDLKPENTGFLKSGDLVIFDCDALDEPGTKRRTFTGSNLAPESAVEFGTFGSVTATNKGDSWGAGVLLYFVLSDGRMPFIKGDSNLYDKLEDIDTCEDASEMRNLESPVFVLRNLGVPRDWVDIVSLLLQRDPNNRPTVLQILSLFPSAANGPLEALKGVDDRI